MTDISKKMFAGILCTVIMLSSSITYFIEKTGDYKNCPEGWVLEDSGQYLCKSRDITEWCYELSESKYRCYIGRVIHTEPDEGDYAEKIEGNQMVRHIGEDEYEIWHLMDRFNKKEVEEEIEWANEQEANLEPCDKKSKYYEYCMESQKREREELLSIMYIGRDRLEAIK